MAKRRYTARFKFQVVLEVRGELRVKGDAGKG